MRCFLIVMLVAVGTSSAVAFDPIVAVSPESLLAEGRVLEERGQWAGALEKYRAAAQMRPELVEPHLRQIMAQRRLLAQAQRESEQAALVTAIRERFAAAAKCGDADWRVYSHWASFLSEVAVPRATGANERRLVFEEALGLTDTAVMQAPAGSDLARAQVQRATLLTVFAPEVADEGRQLALYEEACELFDAATQTDPVGSGQQVSDSRAVAMLHHGRLSGDRDRKNAALALFRESVAKAPADVVRRYNLACAYAALGEGDGAYQELARCLREDKGALVFGAVTKDAEWARLRTEERFQKLLAKHDPAVDAAYQRGWEFQAAADRVAGPQLVAENLQQAIQSYRTVTAARADHFRAWWNLATCYQRLGGLPVAPAERVQLVHSGLEAYQQASRLPEVDWAFLLAWGKFVARDVVGLAASTGEQDKCLLEARRIFEEALQRAKFTGDRARVQLDLAATEIRLGRLATTDREQLKWFDKAVERLQQVVKSDDMASAATPYGLWGLAQLEQGRIQRNRLLLRQAVERLQTAAERAPTDPEIRYNLACTYALLMQTDQAFQQLRICLENDPGRQFAKIALTDRDFDNIRNLPAFAEVVKVRPTGGGLVPAPARISGY